MRTFTTYEVSATKCNFAGKKRQLRIGTLTTCGQLCSQLCTNFERPFIKLTKLPIPLMHFYQKNLWIFLYILISYAENHPKSHLCTFTIMLHISKQIWIIRVPYMMEYMWHMCLIHVVIYVTCIFHIFYHILCCWYMEQHKKLTKSNQALCLAS